MEVLVWIGGVIALGLIGYLLFALLRPERLS
jgi:K+-transporting ATPase KdpF subunit